jgi:cyclomaltodextrin glucanotransferase
VRGETIYFIVVDRFNAGTNDNVGKNTALNDPTHQDWHKYWGGDLQGIINKLDYLNELGVTALWLTPLFEQVEADSWGSSPIHGYWTQDFKRINARWVNKPEEVRLFAQSTVLDTLIAELHKRKMKFILDIVCNHSSPSTSKGKGKLYDDGKLIADFDNDTDHWYHHYGDVKDWNDQWQVQNCELCGLATFNENNLAYRRYITGAIKMWLDKGVDALRIDTVKHMPLWFWQEFNCEIHRHKPNVFIFGEWIHNHPSDPLSVEFVNKAGMSVFDFGLCTAIRSCIAQNAPEGFKLVQDIYDQDFKYRGASELITMYENHDMARLQSIGASNEMLDLATTLLMTGRGVPCLYYGCEQYLHNDTDGGNDPYNRPMMEKWETTGKSFQIIKKLAPERGKNKAIQWGGLYAKIVEKDLYVYVRKYRDNRCLTILNKGPERVLEKLDTELPDGQHMCLLTGEKIRVKNGQAKVKIGQSQARVFSFVGKPVEGRSIARIQLNGANTQPGDKIVIIGDCPELGEWDISRAVPMEYINLNMWFAEICFDQSAGQSIAYKYCFLHPNDTMPGRENRTGRLRPIPVEGISKWRDVWEE